MRVLYVPRARGDVDRIYETIAESNPERAWRVEAAIRAAGELLGREPGLGVAIQDEDARRWPMPDGYAIFYRVNWNADRIEVLRVIGGRQVKNLKRVPR